MGTDSHLPSLAPLDAPNSSQIHTTFSFDGSPGVNNMKNLNPPFEPLACVLAFPIQAVGWIHGTGKYALFHSNYLIL